MMGVGSSYVGEGELARIAKICHNVMLGVVIQNLCEITCSRRRPACRATRSSTSSTRA
jgi:3-hydroxyisobutyrate dehydrogenase-like beta-hydroxyacid dehydrogenase